MTLTETWDLPKLAISDIDFDDDDRYETIDIVVDRRRAVVDEEPAEPTLVAAPFFIEFDEPDQYSQADVDAIRWERGQS